MSKTNVGGKTQILITAVQMDGLQIGTVMLTIYDPKFTVTPSAANLKTTIVKIRRQC